MAKLYITEYVLLATDRAGQPVAAGREPNIAEQGVAIGGASAQSSAFNELTNYIMVHTDAICSIKIGANPTAVTTAHRLAANETRFYGVEAGKSLKIAVISNT